MSGQQPAASAPEPPPDSTAVKQPAVDGPAAKKPAAKRSAVKKKVVKKKAVKKKAESRRSEKRSDAAPGRRRAPAAKAAAAPKAAARTEAAALAGSARPAGPATVSSGVPVPAGAVAPMESSARGGQPGTVAVPVAPPTAGDGRPASARGRTPTDWVGRLLVEPDANGPRIRVALVWFLVLVPAVWFGARFTAILFGLVAAIAALQVRLVWHRLGYWASRPLTAAAALALPLLAVIDERAAGVAFLMLPLLAIAASTSTSVRRRRVSVIGATGLTLRVIVPPALAATGMVLAFHTGPASAIVLVVLVSAYDVGCFLFGAEARFRISGIVGGIICTMALSLPICVFQLPPFDGRPEVFVFAGLVAVAAPLGQFAASLALPSASAWAPALRRLDAYIVTAPMWAWSITSYLR